MWICGIDETGRGALAGPLCVTAFCTQKIPDFYTNDSKKLTPQKRIEIFLQIIDFIKKNKYKTAISIIFIDNKTIDKINILNANLLGFEIAIKKIEKKINQKPHVIYIDGNKSPQMKGYNIITQVKADSKIKVVQIASIVAKVTRDKLMQKLHQKYPLYGFNINKGYYDKLHEKRIREHGPCPLHRLTFINHFLQTKIFT
ncbi:MAG: ribonuclease HII [bacterium]